MTQKESEEAQYYLKDQLSEADIKLLLDFAYKYNLMSYHQKTELKAQVQNIYRIRKEYYAHLS